MVTKRPVQQVAPVAPPTIQTSPQLKSPSASRKKEGTSPLLNLRKGEIIRGSYSLLIILANHFRVLVEFEKEHEMDFGFI